MAEPHGGGLPNYGQRRLSKNIDRVNVRTSRNVDNDQGPVPALRARMQIWRGRLNWETRKASQYWRTDAQEACTMKMTDSAPTRSNGQSAACRVASLATLAAALMLGACATTPPPPQPAPQPPPPPVQVYFYPAKGQSAAQQDRDRYECYRWAVKQSGFDPSAPQLAPHQRIQVTPSPAPGTSTAIGAATGALLGAVVSPPARAAEGAAVGAITGAVIGSASDAARQEQAEQAQRRIDQSEAQRQARLEQQAAKYRRAMTACLEGRGYTVQ